ncbi:MAG: CDP-alcohol phosphatidyltransferase family protein [Bacteroidota bacterium]|jgi:phosphatidylserine synthase
MTNKIDIEILENEIKPQVNKNIQVFEQPAVKGISHKRPMIFKQLRALRWPDMLTLLGLLCVSFSVYFSLKGFLIIAYVLILMQFLLDYFDGRLARAIGAGVLGVYLDSFTDFMAVASSVVFGWFVGINGIAMLIAGFLNVGAASIRLAYFTSYKQKGFTGVPTVLAASAVSTIAFLGYFFVQAHLAWFVIFYFISAVAMISDLRLKKI